MPYVFMYVASDFVSLPAEASGGGSAVNPPLTLTLRATAVPIRVMINDSDPRPGHFDEVTTLQTIGAPVTVGSTTYPAGTKLQGAYHLYTGAGRTGEVVTTFRFGTDGNDTGPVQGLITSFQLQPGQSYLFRSGITTHGNTLPYDRYVACFSAGTLIATPTGPRPIEDLAVGDLVDTRDNGARPLRWIGRRRLGAAELRLNPLLAPVLIRAGALGVGIPAKDLLVSRQHRILLRSRIAARMFGSAEVLVAAHRLTGLPGIEQLGGGSGVTYFHLLLDRHEVLLSNGAETESFHPGVEAMKSVDAASRAEILALFPQLADGGPGGMARPLAEGRPGDTLVRRHLKTGARPVSAQ